MSLRVHLFGGLLLESGGRVLPPIPSRLARNLLAYLVLNPDRDLDRVHLAATFWPDLPESRGRRRLSQILWQLQAYMSETAGSEIIKQDPGSIRLDSTGLWLDTAAIEAAYNDAVQTGNIESLDPLVAASRGEVLAGFYDDWALATQRYGNDLLRRALQLLVRHYKSLGDINQAIDRARRLAELDPLDESTHRELMRLLYVTGNSNMAIKQYRLCRRILRAELGAEPEPETTELHQSILSHRRQTNAPELETTLHPIIGRQAERERTAAVLDEVTGGTGRVVVIAGEPGIGKSRLLEVVAADARWRGFTVLWGTCSSDAAIPYEPIGKAFGALSRQQWDLLEAQLDAIWMEELNALASRSEAVTSPALRPAEERDRLSEAVTRATLALARRTPVLLVVEDVHFASEDTMRVLKHLVNIVGRHPLAIFVSHRTSEGEVAKLLRSDEQIDLGPLDAETARRLLAASAALNDETMRQMVARSVGNPLLLLENARHAAGPPLEQQATASLETMIAGRLHQLATTARSVVEAMAVTGQSAELAVLESVTDLTGTELAGQVSELDIRGFVAVSEGSYRFHHDQVREAILTTIPQSRLRHLHRRVAEALRLASPGNFGVLAHHFREAGAPAEAVEFGRLAYEEAMRRRAYSAAASVLERTIPLAQAGATQLGLMFDFESVLDVLGRRQDQEEILDAIESVVTEPVEVAEALRRRALLLANTDRFEAATRAAERALEVDYTTTPETLIALGTIGIWSGDVAGAIASLRRALETSTDPDQQGRARQALGSALTNLQKYDEAATEARGALGIFAAADDRRGQAEALGLLGIISMERGELSGAIDYYGRAIDHCRAIGYRHGEGVNLVNLGNALWHSGRAAEALVRWHQAIDVFQAIGNRRGEAIVQANVASLSHVLLGEQKEAKQYSESALAYFAESRNDTGIAQCLTNLADIAATAGQHNEARRQIDQALAAVERSGNRWLEIQVRYSQAVIELESGDPEASRRAAAAGLELSGDVGAPDFDALLLSISGESALHAGDPQEALRQTAAGVDRLAEAGEQGWLVHYRHFLARSALGDPEADSSLAIAYSSLMKAISGLDADQRRQARRASRHRELIETHEASRPTRRTVKLAAADVPTGRAVEPHELVDVVWTVNSPSDHDQPDRSTRRRTRLRRLIQEASDQGALPTVENLAEAVEASVTTVKRDLRELRRTGIQIVTRGNRAS